MRRPAHWRHLGWRLQVDEARDEARRWVARWVCARRGHRWTLRLSGILCERCQAFIPRA